MRIAREIESAIVLRQVSPWCVLMTALLPCFLFSGCDYAKGRAAVEQMCATDGGLQINETVNVRGYLDSRKHYICSVCMEAIGRHGFDYVDAQLEEHRNTILYAQPGYYRHSRSHIGDPRCEKYLSRRSNNQVQSQEQLGLAPNECIAIELLPSRPQEFVYDRKFRKLTADIDVPLGVVERAITNEASGEVLAIYRDYLFTSKWTLRGDMSGGGGKIDEHCEDPQERSIRGQRFVSRVLKDPAKPLQ